jgi:hypothetical protein
MSFIFWVRVPDIRPIIELKSIFIKRRLENLVKAGETWTMCSYFAQERTTITSKNYNALW